MHWESVLSNMPVGEAEALACGEWSSAAFAGFYARVARPLWAYLARVSGDPALADDLAQESFVRFLSAERALDGEIEARRYLFRIATNLLRDHWRRKPVESLDNAAAQLTCDASFSIDSRLMLAPALMAMGPRERQLLWLAYAEGYSHGEIASITGLASASVRILLFRARRKMARMFNQPKESLL